MGKKPNKFYIPVQCTVADIVRALKNLNAIMPSTRDIYRANLRNLDKDELVELLIDSEMKNQHIKDELSRVKYMLSVFKTLSVICLPATITIAVAFAMNVYVV